MRIEDRFRVNVPIEQAWDVLLDIERIAPCLPGAQLQEIEGNEFRGVVKVKVGPITAAYKGSARIEQVDPVARTIVIRGMGRDTRGAGNASATINVAMREVGDGTEVGIDTDLAITGKVAQFGRGVMADVSAKLLAQFVENLERDVLASGNEEPVVVVAVAVEELATGDILVDEAVVVATPSDDTRPNTPAWDPTSRAAAPGGARTINAREVDPVDLLDTAGAPLLKRLLPVLLGATILVLVLRRRRRR
jgi:carbon monoxide dehydrogenase subunit G